MPRRNLGSPVRRSAPLNRSAFRPRPQPLHQSHRHPIRRSLGTDPGLILVVVVIPVVLVALIWLGYIFWLIFHEGENIGSGSPPPRVNQAEQPPDRRQEPPERPGSVG